MFENTFFWKFYIQKEFTRAASFMCLLPSICIGVLMV